MMFAASTSGTELGAQTKANDPAASIVGSAQLITTGKIGGFETFGWTTFDKEASAPLETARQFPAGVRQ